jgi:hypothetical protein
MSVYAFTSITLNYLCKARTLFSTLNNHHPDWVRVAVVVERALPGIREALTALPEIDEVILFEDLEVHGTDNTRLDEAGKERWMFRHDVVEACTAVKGSALSALLRKPGCEAVFYLDPDMVVFDRLDKLTGYLSAGHSITLTPHTCDPEPSLASVPDNEIGPLRWGIFNLGFLGVANVPEGHRFAAWWKNRIEFHCYNETSNGAFTDQGWCDLVPVFFDGVKIVRDPEFNVATWNLTTRKVSGSLGGLQVNGGAKLALFHFSGHDKGMQLVMLQKYGQDMPGLFEMRDWYLQTCEGFEEEAFRNHPWTFGRFEDDAEIAGNLRLLYRTREDLWNAFPKPFLSGAGSLQRWYAVTGIKEEAFRPERMHKHRPMRWGFTLYKSFRKMLPFL